MRVTFLCGALEPGRDGVGDYSRRLAAEIIQRGHACSLLALNDPNIQEIRSDNQSIAGVSVPTLRLPVMRTWEQKISEAQEWLGAFQPGWVSFQFVPFSYNRKGICFGLGKRLAAINSTAPWHLMFHELWLGLAIDAPLKDRIYGALQRRFILDLVHRLRPRAFHTQAEPYARVLKKNGIGASILPLFSNIPHADGDAWDDLLKPLIARESQGMANREGFYLAGILGGVHPEWNPATPVNAFLPLLQRSNKQLVLVFIGKNNLSAEAFEDLKSKLRDCAIVVATGEKSDVVISKILKTLDFGLATSPLQMIAKSGSAAAMLEHGLQLLVSRDDWRLRETNAVPDVLPPGVLSMEQFARLKILPVRDANIPVRSGVQKVADSLLASFAQERRVASATPA